MSFRIFGLDPAPFAHLATLDPAALAAGAIRRSIVDRTPSFPCRVALRDLDVGETVHLLNYEHQPAPTPYRASHAIYVGAGSTRFDEVDVVPPALARRVLSLRAFDVDGDMRDAALQPGTELPAALAALFSDPAVAYVHAHYATRGCFAARCERARPHHA